MASSRDSGEPQTTGLARHTVGMGLLLVVVVLWTASNFLGSVCSQIPRALGAKAMRSCCTIIYLHSFVHQTIFADNTYPKPFFVTYINTSLFILPLFTILLGRTWTLWRSNRLSQVTSFRSLLRHLDTEDPKGEEQSIIRGESFDNESRTHDVESPLYASATSNDQNTKLGLRATAKLSLEFCLLWVSKMCLLR